MPGISRHLILVVCMLLPRCTGTNNPSMDDRVHIVNDAATLSQRFVSRDDTLEITNSMRGDETTTVDTPLLTLIAEVSHPSVGGVVTQATAVHLKADFAYISYNMRGESHVGGVDVVQLKEGKNAELRSHVYFTDTDVSAVAFDQNYVYAAEATSSGGFLFPAAVERLRSNGGFILLEEQLRRGLKSYAATSIMVDDTLLRVTTGSDGGLYTMKKNSLDSLSYTPIADARWVTTWDDTLAVVVSGTPGRITVVNNQGAVKATFTFTGASIPESKSTVCVTGGKAVIAAGNGGVCIMNLATGNVVGSIPRLIVPGLDSMVTVTNSVAASSAYLFISNGEAGVYVAQASSDLDQNTGDTPIAFTMLGKINFQSLQSVNHIAYNGRHLIVAAGTGGVKVIRVTL